MADVLDMIEHKSGFQVKESNLHRNGELSVRFAGINSIARFSFVGEEGDQRPAVEARRLRALTEKLAGELDRVSHIDLAYPTMAIIRLGAANSLS